MSEIKWIKIVTDIFDDEKILLIEGLPECDSIIVIWFKLLCLAGKQNNRGVFMMNDKIPYTDKMLATIFRRKESTVKMALETFKNFGMIEIVNNTVTIPNWGKYQNIEKLEERREYQRNYQRKYREEQKLIADKTQRKSLRKCLHERNVNAIDKDKEIDKEKDKREIRDINTYARSDSRIASVQEPKAQVEAIPLTDGTEWKPTVAEYEEYHRLYPAVDIEDAFRRMRAWSNSNPTKKKTRNGVKRFVNTWMSRAQDNAAPTRQRSGSAYMDAINNRVNVVDDWMNGGVT